jgi:hypothetical protein
VILGSVLATAEASLTRMSRVRALALVEEGRRNASVLARLEADPPRYLNAVYLTVMLCQNGSAIIVAALLLSSSLLARVHDLRYRIDVNQESVGQGMANVGAALADGHSTADAGTHVQHRGRRTGPWRPWPARRLRRGPDACG